ncbi:MAG: hypothetical protein ACI31O_06460 [Limosilactobacillus vaginalis]|uniref:sunset domain-containing protein n=1 Tax=Limosilactobacillus vaginalis TaxID=1633 RepID=UPI003EFE162A
MKNKGLGTIIGFIFVLFIIVWLFKILVLLGIIGSIIAIFYYGIEAIKEQSNRKSILLKRVLPSFIALLICGGLYGSLNNTTKGSSNSASSTKLSSSSSKEESNKESNKDSSDDELSSEEDSSNSSTDSDNNSTDETNSTATSDSDNTDTNATAKGDMETDQQGTIVGNSRTMVYHTPDQHGYRMSSANAVYFNTEAEAQAAGYRKSEK